MKHYHEVQNDRWYEQYLESQKTINELEQALLNVETLALKSITDEPVREAIEQIVKSVWPGKKC
jgi:hypothetical protein